MDVCGLFEQLLYGIGFLLVGLVAAQ